jgi:hypothetical protein
VILPVAAGRHGDPVRESAGAIARIRTGSFGLAPWASRSPPRVEREGVPHGPERRGVSLLSGAFAFPAPSGSSFGGSTGRPPSSCRLMGRTRPTAMAAARSPRGWSRELAVVNRALPVSFSRRTAGAARRAGRSPRSDSGAAVQRPCGFGRLSSGPCASVPDRAQGATETGCLRGAKPSRRTLQTAPFRVPMPGAPSILWFWAPVPLARWVAFERTGCRTATRIDRLPRGSRRSWWPRTVSASPGPGGSSQLPCGNVLVPRRDGEPSPLSGSTLLRWAL